MPTPPLSERKPAMTGTRPILGWLLVGLAGASLLVTLIACIQVLTAREQATEATVRTLQAMQQTLTTTSQGLDQAEIALKLVSVNLSGLQSTASGIADAVDGLRPAVSNVSQMTQSSLASSVKAAQVALTTAQTAAEYIDNFFASAASVPLLRDLVARSQPAVPLSVALGRVSQSLNSIPTDLGALGSSLETTDGRLGQVSGDIRDLGAGLKDISLGLTGVQQVITDYRAQVANYQMALRAAEAQAPAWLWSLTVLLLFILFWLGVVQTFTLVKGLEWATGRHYL